jgi:hypothetical protein
MNLMYLPKECPQTIKYKKLEELIKGFGDVGEAIVESAKSAKNRRGTIRKFKKWL